MESIARGEKDIDKHLEMFSRENSLREGRKVGETKSKREGNEKI